MDINISANTLFHFTPNRQNLLSILTNGLYVRYSLENYESLIDGDAEIVFPMTCFCDIPLSQIKRHSLTYGKYAIGLTKEWGMKNEVNPVIYTYPKSNTANLLNEMVIEMNNFFDITDEEMSKSIKGLGKKKNSISMFDMMDDPQKNYKSHVAKQVIELQHKVSHFLKYIKPYEGKFYRNGDYLPNPIKFYDEREWRFAPSRKFFASNFVSAKDSYSREYYIDPIKRRAVNMRLAKSIKLNFQPKDVRFIIVNRESEIPKMLDDLEKIYGNSISLNEWKLLGTRLISLEQIIDDI